VTEFSVVIPTHRRTTLLAQALDRLERQTVSPERFEVVVVQDDGDSRSDVERAIGSRPFEVRRLVAGLGPASKRNVGWRAARGRLIVFIDDDVFADPTLLAEHLTWHARHPEPTWGVLGHLRWSRALRVTPFMRWLEQGIQFDYGRAEGQLEPGWWHFYTANASVHRALLERVGGFDEEAFPSYGYEDLDIAARMAPLGFRLLYNAAATAEHHHPQTLADWRERVAKIAVSEREFVRRHSGYPPYFHDLFTAALAQPPARGRGVRIARWVPRATPWIGPRAWASVDVWHRQQLAAPFLAAWEAAGDRPGSSLAGAGGPTGAGRGRTDRD
jgi:GT2 family glycosyltransferase